MKKSLLAIAFAMVAIFTISQPEAAGKGDLIRRWMPFADDIIKVGKQAPKAAKSQIEAITRRMPALEGKNPDLINGIINIEKITAKNPTAGKFIERGLNPARVVVMAEKNPGQLKLGDDIGEMFAKIDPRETVSGLPAKAFMAVKRIGGDYAKAGESFFEMARRGGKNAVQVAGKLYDIATSRKTAAAVATGLLAWHMADPEGAEEAVRDFFSDHVAPMLNSPVQGMIEGGGNAADRTLSVMEEKGAMIWENHRNFVLTCIGIGCFLLFFLFIPNFWRLLFAVPNALFGKLLD